MARGTTHSAVLSWRGTFHAEIKGKATKTWGGNRKNLQAHQGKTPVWMFILSPGRTPKTGRDGTGHRLPPQVTEGEPTAMGTFPLGLADVSYGSYAQGRPFGGGGGVVSPASPLASSPFPDCLLLRGIAWALLPCRAVPPPAPATLYFFSSLSPFSSQAAAASASLRASYRLPGLGKPARGGHLVQRAPAATLGPPASVALQRSDCLKFESCLRHELRGWSWASH